MSSPWLQIPLADYEAHMGLPDVAQAAALSEELGRLLAAYPPASLALLGCAGGSGLEHVGPETTRRVAAVDINPVYLEATRSRFASRLPGLELHLWDVETLPPPFEPVDLVFAGLLFEYVSAEALLRFARAAVRRRGVLGCVLQLPSDKPAVTPSPYSSLRVLEPVMRLVDPAELTRLARSQEFVLQESREMVMPNGKLLLAQTYCVDSPQEHGL
jgi:hypothetical protein